MSGLQPLWFHACNVLLHAAASLLFTRVCLAIAGLQPNFAGAAGVLFAAHPIHTEAVSVIAQTYFGYAISFRVRNTCRSVCFQCVYVRVGTHL